MIQSRKRTSGHLTNGNGENDKKNKAPDKEDGEEEVSLAQSDYQLYEALNLLKGLAIQRELMQ